MSGIGAKTRRGLAAVLRIGLPPVAVLLAVVALLCWAIGGWGLLAFTASAYAVFLLLLLVTVAVRETWPRKED